MKKVTTENINPFDAGLTASGVQAPNGERLPSWLRLEQGYQAQIDNDVLCVWSEKYPEFRMRFSEKRGERNVRAAYQATFDAFKAKLDTYSTKITDLKNTYGFEVHVKGDAVFIEQPDYGLSYTLPLNNHVDLLDQVNKIEDAAEGVYLVRMEHYEDLLANAKEFKEIPTTADNGSTVTEIRHSSLKEPLRIVKHGPLERIDATGAKAISQALKTIKEAKIAAHTNADQSQTPPAQVPSTNRVRRPSLKELLPIGQKASLIFDLSALSYLEANRGGDRTWMDILPITAALPTVDKIYIPSVVADWECRGGITRNKPDGSIEFQVIDPKTAAPHHRPATHELLATASRWKIGNDGKGYLITGKNPNIVIYESPIDHILVNEAAKIADNPDLSGIEQQEAIYQLRESAKDFGERSMEHVAKTLEGKGPAFLISQDIDFLMNRREIHTADGFPVSEATLVGYLKAAIEAHGHHISRKLENKYNVPVGRMELDRIKQDILKANKLSRHDQYPNGYPDGKAFPYMSPTGRASGETLHSIFRRGSLLLDGKDAPYDYKKYPLPYTIAKTDADLLSKTGKPALVDLIAPVGAIEPMTDEAPTSQATPAPSAAHAAAEVAVPIAAVAAAKLATERPVPPAAMPSPCSSSVVPATAPTNIVLANGRTLEASQQIISARVALDAWLRRNTQLSGAALAVQAGITNNDLQFLASISKRPMQIRVDRLIQSANKIAALLPNLGIDDDGIQYFQELAAKLIEQAAKEKEAKGRE